MGCTNSEWIRFENTALLLTVAHCRSSVMIRMCWQHDFTTDIRVLPCCFCIVVPVWSRQRHETEVQRRVGGWPPPPSAYCTSYDQPVRLDIIGITCRHPRPTGSSPCVDSSESCSTAQAARIYWDPPIRRYDADAWRPHSVSVTECGHQADFNGCEAPGPSGCASPMDGAAGEK